MEWISCVIGTIFLIWIIISDIRDKNGLINDVIYRIHKPKNRFIKPYIKWYWILYPVYIVALILSCVFITPKSLFGISVISLNIISLSISYCAIKYYKAKAKYDFIDFIYKWKCRSDLDSAFDYVITDDMFVIYKAFVEWFFDIHFLYDNRLEKLDAIIDMYDKKLSTFIYLYIYLEILLYKKDTSKDFNNNLSAQDIITINFMLLVLEQLNISGRLNGAFYFNQKSWLNELKTNRRWSDRNPQTLCSEFTKLV